jgi:hypothetical protein
MIATERLDPERKPNNHLTVAFEHNVVVRARMVVKRSLENGGDSANNAERVLIILPGALNPFSSLFDVDLSQNMVVPHRHGRQDRNRVMLIVDSCHTVGENGVHEAHEASVTDPRHTVPDDSDVGGWS